MLRAATGHFFPLVGTKSDCRKLTLPESEPKTRYAECV